jgi:hypothetical protein
VANKKVGDLSRVAADGEGWFKESLKGRESVRDKVVGVKRDNGPLPSHQQKGTKVKVVIVTCSSAKVTPR